MQSGLGTTNPKGSSMKKAYLRPRPIRTAYLVEETERWRATLERIFNDAFGRWGGRFSLIVPCINGAVHPEYPSRSSDLYNKRPQRALDDAISF